MSHINTFLILSSPSLTIQIGFLTGNVPNHGFKTHVTKMEFLCTISLSVFQAQFVETYRATHLLCSKNPKEY